ncbi:hypothetical protein AOXY_G1590 [Acipenser oxyrinchus oxyrinchus]|uniref:Uncharacterized protein n=1 Tax=Acipenser oxyrinchus oxyrinchus TaxID=40147 RepID=A0AAD8GHD4_ACIOX|nr:hypothetical protein AOXY_G1590 [Acipenser oxyrinchus oxyrinchus]
MTCAPQLCVLCMFQWTGEPWVSGGTMPKRRAAESLVRLCLSSVADNMKEWARDYTDNYLDQYSFLYIMGPFNQLPGSLVQELLRLLSESHRVSRTYLHLLLVPHLSALSLSGCSSIVSNAVAQLVGARCQSLTSLCLRDCKRVQPGVLVDLAELLPGLRSLDLSGSQCNTQVLCAVGSSCPALRELHVSNCRAVTSRGLLHLAFDPTRGCSTHSQLRRLAASNIDSRGGADTVGPAAFLLLALPHLEHLDHSGLVEACTLISRLHFQTIDCFAAKEGFPSLSELVHSRAGEGVDGETSPVCLNLRQMSEVEAELLGTLTPLCGEVVEASVLCGEELGSDWGLSLWKTLTHLTVQSTGVHSRPLRDLLLALEVLGPSLRLLTIQDFSLDDSLDPILSLCPNLRVLHCHLQPPATALHEDHEADDSTWAMELRLLHFRDFFLGFPPCSPGLTMQTCAGLQGALASLLAGAPQMERVSLHSLPFSLDRVLCKALEGPGAPLCRLQHLSLAHSSVSMGTVLGLMDQGNQLSRLDLSGCQDIYRRDFDRLESLARERGYDLQITWS